VTGGLLTLSRPSSGVRRCPSVQVDGSHVCAAVSLERRESGRLAVNLAVRSPVPLRALVAPCAGTCT
jgi:hypothetical protein